MTKTIEVLRILLPVALTLGLGALCREKKLLDRRGVEALKTVAVQIGLPAVLLHTFATADYSLSTLAVPPLMFLLCVLAWALGRLAGKKLGPDDRFLPFLTTGFEAGMLGYALFPLLYGTERLADFARIDLGQVLFVFTLYKALLYREEKGRVPLGRLLREMFLSPIILAILAGVLLGATGLYRRLIPGGAASLLDACTDFISAPVGTLILLAIGYDLVLKDIPWRKALRAVGLRLAVMAVLGGAMLLLFRLVWPAAHWEKAACLMFLLPPPFVLPVFSKDEQQRVYLSSVLSLSTLVTLCGFIVLAMVG